MIIHKPQSKVHCTMIKINGTENDMEDGTEMLYTETNCFVKLKPKEVENVFHLENESSNLLCQNKFDITVHPNNTKFIFSLVASDVGHT